jgi:hypothetical protein
MRYRYLATLVAALLFCSSVHAEIIDAAAQASMLVQGTAVLNPDGNVASYALKQQDKLPAPVVGLIAQSLPSWKFQFTDPQSEPVQENMWLRILAIDVDRQHTTLHIASAQFERAGQPDNERVRVATQARVAPPSTTTQADMSGTVYVLARVGRDGKVQEAAAEQVNLHRYAEKSLMDAYRMDLARVSVASIKKWTFDVPTAGTQAKSPYWYVRVAFEFHIASDLNDPSHGGGYGKWEFYVPGPRASIPWLRERKLFTEAPDAMPKGGMHTLGSDAELVTQLAPD